MPRKGRIDAPGALHHIIIRGIEKKVIFRKDKDRERFLSRLGEVLFDTSTLCFAWVLMSNHAHFLLRTGAVPIATVMRRLREHEGLMSLLFPRVLGKAEGRS